MYGREFDQSALRTWVIDAAAFIRGKMETHGCGDRRFTMKIIVEGSGDKRDATLKVMFDTSHYYGAAAESPWLDAAVTELLRRAGFDEQHRPKLLTWDAEEEERLAVLQAPVRAPGAD